MPLLRTQTASRPLRCLLYRGFGRATDACAYEFKTLRLRRILPTQLVGNNKEPREGVHVGRYLINVCSQGIFMQNFTSMYTGGQFEALKAGVKATTFRSADQLYNQHS